jgi:hypothetical protein
MIPTAIFFPPAESNLTINIKPLKTNTRIDVEQFKN